MKIRNYLQETITTSDIANVDKKIGGDGPMTSFIIRRKDISYEKLFSIISIYDGITIKKTTDKYIVKGPVDQINQIRDLL